MQITYSADAPVREVLIEGYRFTAGQTQDVPDDHAAAILTNPNFVDESGSNPNHVCVECGKPALDLVRPNAEGPVLLVRETRGLPTAQALAVQAAPDFEHTGRVCADCHANVPADQPSAVPAAVAQRAAFSPATAPATAFAPAATAAATIDSPI